MGVASFARRHRSRASLFDKTLLGFYKGRLMNIANPEIAN
jgi:hypothetical protein